MDAHDLFRQLTRGARFKRKPPQQGANVTIQKKEVTIKEEALTDSEDEDQSSNEDVDVKFELVSAADDGTPPQKKIKTKPSRTENVKQVEDEMVATLRREHRIVVKGSNIPPPITSFDELHEKFNVSASLVKNITVHFDHPTPIQMQSIPILLKGRALMACAPTGSGKTVAFLTPIINDLSVPKKVGFRAIVLAPTRELAQQIYRECVRLAEKTALRVHFINKISQRVEQMFGPNGGKKCDILISTPNRVRYLLQQQPPKLDLSKIEWFVLDEADRLMEEGQNNFKDQLDDILNACTNSEKKLALFSATYTVPVAKWALKNLKHLARVTVGQQNTATDSVDQELLFVGSESGKLLAIRDMVRTGLKPPVLIFVQSKDRAKQLFEELLYDGINVDVIHADRTQQQRDNCVRAFREGNIWVLICTELMGRGIDFKCVNLVINYDFPQSTIAYIHRIGRTGRAGRRGKAITFFTEDDKVNLRTIAQIIKNAGGKVPEFALTMKKTRKTDRKRLEMIAPKREDISTKIRPPTEPPQKVQSEKVEKSKLKNKSDSQQVSKGKKKKKQ